MQKHLFRHECEIDSRKIHVDVAVAIEPSGSIEPCLLADGHETQRENPFFPLDLHPVLAK